MRAKEPSDPRRILLFTTHREIEAEVLARVVARAQALNASLKVLVTIPIDKLDQDVDDHLLPLEALKPLAERRRHQRMELLLTAYQPLLAGEIEVCVTTGLEYIELLRARVFEDFACVFWVKDGAVQVLEADAALYVADVEDDLELDTPQADTC